MQVTERVPTLWGCIAGVDCTKRWAPRKELLRGIVQDCISLKCWGVNYLEDGGFMSNLPPKTAPRVPSPFDPEGSPKFHSIRLNFASAEPFSKAEMHLRVRDTSSGRTWRVQLDQSPPTFQNLEDSVIQQCFSSQETPMDGSQNLSLSLNKKVRNHSCCYNLEIFTI